MLQKQELPHMSHEEPKIYHYPKSFLLFLHLLLGGAFIVYTFFLIDGYTKNVMQGTIFTLLITLFYFYLLYVSAKLYNKQQRGNAYFLTIIGFLAGVFFQVVTCSYSITFVLH
jgi:hypothetical protein